MTHSSQFETAMQSETAKMTLSTVKSASRSEKFVPLPTTLKFQPHTKPQTVISGWAWAVFMISVVMLSGSAFFVSYTKTGAVPQVPVNLLRG